MYNFNKQTGRFELELSIDYYKELFNDWDAAPMRKKDLDPELVSYLETVAEDIPMKYRIDIVFVMQDTFKDEALEDISKQVFENYFHYLIHFNKRHMNKLIRKAFMYMILGFAFITIAVNFRNVPILSYEIFSEGLFIGGWVFMWEAVSLLFFRVAEYWTLNKRYKRFASSDITYIYR